MVTVFVFYDTKYGNTKLVAETIMERLTEIQGIETATRDIEEVDLEKKGGCDAILIGAPNQMGGPSWTVREFIDKLEKLDLKAKQVAVFDACLGADFEKAVKKMEKRIAEKVPGLKLITSGLSIRVGGMKGPIVEGELHRCKEFAEKMAAQITT